MNSQPPTTSPVTPRPWQRQPDELPADFMAFVAYLRLKGRRSHRTVAEATGRKLGAIRRLSARFNWPGRVAAFESRLADATQTALDTVLRARPAASKSELEQLRIREFHLAHEVLQRSQQWLERASDPRRRNVSLTQVCTLIALASKLGRLSSGLPTGNEPSRRKRKEDLPGYWTGPSVEEALKKIYGPQAEDADLVPDAEPGAPPHTGEQAIVTSVTIPAPNVTPPAGQELSTCKQPSTSADSQAPTTPQTSSPPPMGRPGRRDAWGEWARQQRRSRPT